MFSAFPCHKSKILRFFVINLLKQPILYNVSAMDKNTAKKIIEILSVINPDMLDEVYDNHLRLIQYVQSSLA